MATRANPSIPRGRAERPVALIARDDVLARRLTAHLAKHGFVVASDAEVAVVVVDSLSPDEQTKLARLKAELGTPVVAVVGSATLRAIRNAVGGAVDGVVAEAEVERALAPTVAAVLSGQVVVPSSFRGVVGRPTLSAREKQVLAMVVMGFSNAEIASKLFVAESTVKSHLNSVFARLGVRSRHEATAMILDPDGGLGAGILSLSESDGSER